MTIINTPYEPGAPLKVWDDQEPEHRVMVEMVIQTGAAVVATQRLLAAKPLTDGDWAAFGRANYHAFLAGFEPAFALIGEYPIVDPAIETVLRSDSELHGW